ncbi:MAG: UrcA family protein [Pseudomonadota bacterium]|nr:UrcA family protein [Pseudomonadota bacterium]
MTRTVLSFAAAVLLYAAPAVAQEVRVPFADLDLSNGAGARTFDQRAASAARTVCAVCAVGPRGLVNDNCVRRVQQEAVRALPVARQDDYARARRGDRILAMVAPAWPA